VVAEGTETSLTFVRADRAATPAEVETISLELTCTNRQLPTRLAVGDVSAGTDTSPVFARFRNVTRPTASVPPPLGGDLYWKLLSHLSLSSLSLLDIAALRSLLALYHFRARVDRQAEQGLQVLLGGLRELQATPATRLVRGAPLRGLSVALTIDEAAVGGAGEAYLFGSVLDLFLASYVSLNSFSRLVVKGAKSSEVHEWPPRLGARTGL
jgi:type VI secretion system protein ImpG